MDALGVLKLWVSTKKYKCKVGIRRIRCSGCDVGMSRLLVKKDVYDEVIAEIEKLEKRYSNKQEKAPRRD